MKSKNSFNEKQLINTIKSLNRYLSRMTYLKNNQVLENHACSKIRIHDFYCALQFSTLFCSILIAFSYCTVKPGEKDKEKVRDMQALMSRRERKGKIICGEKKECRMRNNGIVGLDNWIQSLSSVGHWSNPD